MKFKKGIVAGLGIAMSVVALTGCAAQMFEEEINVVFKNEGQIVETGKVTQFDNIKSPTISDAYIPTDFRFLGWTAYDIDEMDYSSPTNFKTQYIGGGRMVHYMDVRDHAEDNTVVLNALIMHKDDIPMEYHYAVVAWYNKPAMSGITEEQIAAYETSLHTYLAAEGVSEEDLATVVVRGYSGNVGPSTGEIIYDNDVDVMLGWGSLDNITTTGQFAPEDVLESVGYEVTYQGTVKTRHLHRLTENPGAYKVMEHLQLDSTRAIFVS